MRVLPAYLRDVLQLLHRRCRGPDCDRWVTWTQAHHERRYAHGGRTDLNQSIPLCEGHHDLDDQGWHIQLDPDTLIVTWTSPTGRIITTRP
jgi:predicted restriction endonuclease